MTGDITDRNTCKEIIDSTVEKFGRIDVLVNNAGLFMPSTFMETSEELLDKLFNVNFKSVFMLTKLAVPHLIKSKGNHILELSLSILYAFPSYSVIHYHY